MRSSVLIVMLGMSLLVGCLVRRAQDVPVASYDAGAPPVNLVTEPVPAATSTGDDAFVNTIRPILVERCSPCHEPGGTMYAKLPFDQPETIRSHSAGALKRFSGEEKKTVEAWLASVPK